MLLLGRRATGHFTHLPVAPGVQIGYDVHGRNTPTGARVGDMHSASMVVVKESNVWRVVLVGRSERLHGMRKIVLPGQPRGGFRLQTDAMDWARRKYSPDDVPRLADGREGALVPAAVLDTLDPIPVFAPPAQAVALAQPVAPPPVSMATGGQPELDEAAALIVQRRAALRELALIDKRLAELLGPAHRVIVDGMGAPLPIRPEKPN